MKYHIGCGKRDFGKDWVHIDAAKFPHIQGDDIYLTKVPPGSATLIYCSHMLEYLDRSEAEELIQSWRKALVDEGKLRIAVPDFEVICKLYTSDRRNYPVDKFLGLLYGKMALNGTTIYHKTVYDFDSLHDLLNGAGFGRIHRYDWGTTDHSHIDDHSQAYMPHMHKATGTLMSLNIEAIK
jgi:predicted SAM-dependent methyltransferase